MTIEPDRPAGAARRSAGEGLEGRGAHRRGLAVHDLEGGRTQQPLGRLGEVHPLPAASGQQGRAALEGEHEGVGPQPQPLVVLLGGVDVVEQAVGLARAAPGPAGAGRPRSRARGPRAGRGRRARSRRSTAARWCCGRRRPRRRARAGRRAPGPRRARRGRRRPGRGSRSRPSRRGRAGRCCAGPSWPGVTSPNTTSSVSRHSAPASTTSVSPQPVHQGWVPVNDQPPSTRVANTLGRGVRRWLQETPPRASPRHSGPSQRSCSAVFSLPASIRTTGPCWNQTNHASGLAPASSSATRRWSAAPRRRRAPPGRRRPAGRRRPGRRRRPG